MPITMDDLTKITKKTVLYSPKFFSKNLTGNGGKIGILCDTEGPAFVPQSMTYIRSENKRCKKRSFTNGNTHTDQIPFYILPIDAWEDIREVPCPELAALTKIAEGTSKNGTDRTDVYIKIKCHSAILETTKTKTVNAQSSLKHTNTFFYQIETYFIQFKNGVQNTDPCTHINTRVNASLIKNNLMLNEYSINPLHEWYPEIKKWLENNNFNCDDGAFGKYITDYDLYADICETSKTWQTTLPQVLNMYFENLNKHGNGKFNLAMVVEIVKRLEQYKVPLELYKEIYADIKKWFSVKDTAYICKQNLNLLLSDTLNNLNDNKGSIQKINQPTKPVAIESYYSDAQKAAITTDEPLALVQAGAGTGKSTVVLGRIKYMLDCGVDPKDILVISFTNNAADHIVAKDASVHSMTIASMIHEIYCDNYGDHKLSQIPTLVNCIEIFYGDKVKTDHFLYEFRRRLIAVHESDANAFVAMNNFVEENYDKVIDVLNTIEQVSLEMEIIICYQQIDNFTEPDSVKSKYLIIDEVQDNSIFEFIYTLKYIDKHTESLFVVGDCSQTLYEFRASNPKALNILEGSGVFATYQLETNYRSCQEILDFANLLLLDIEANQYANIQLEANDKSYKVTEQSFKERVQLCYKNVKKLSDFNSMIDGCIRTDCKKYIDDCLAKKEKVTFLAFTRDTVFTIQNALNTHYPKSKVCSLVPERMYTQTVFTTFIKKYWDQMSFIPTKNMQYTIGHEIVAKLDYLCQDKQRSLPAVQKMLQQWYTEQGPNINGWALQVQQNTMSVPEFMTNVRNNMIQFEIDNNAVKQRLLAEKNNQQKTDEIIADADFVISTIHSAKGLEFDNVVLIFRNENDLSEEKKRMYYVALTRAMKSEFILAYDTVVKPKIEGDYNFIVKLLQEKAAATSGRTLAEAKAEDTEANFKRTVKEIRERADAYRNHTIGGDTKKKKGKDPFEGMPY